jgi:hypothetical protein
MHTSSADNATVDVVTDRLSCAGGNLVHTAAKSSAFPALYVYKNLRAYALSFLNRFGLCTFPVGKPQPYYRCHSGDLYEVCMTKVLAWPAFQKIVFTMVIFTDFRNLLSLRPTTSCSRRFLLYRPSSRPVGFFCSYREP